MKHLIDLGLLKSKYLVISYNDEGNISSEDWILLLSDYDFKKNEIVYDTFKGSRNLSGRDDKVTEIIYVVWKK